MDSRNDAIALEALDDVARWLGFDDAIAYSERLPYEREHIFERAENAIPQT